MLAFHFVAMAAVLLQWTVIGLVIPEDANSETSHYNLEARAKKTCPGGGGPPCVCGGQIGLRASTLNCPNERFTFDDPTDPKNGKMSSSEGGKGPGLQCDHIVELQFISKQITADMCKHFLSGAGGKKDMKRFFDVINKSPNLVFLDDKVNIAKGGCFNSKINLSNLKSALGVVSHVEQILSNATIAAERIKAEMDSISATAGFTSFKPYFVDEYNIALKEVISTAKRNAARLSKDSETTTVTGKRPASDTSADPTSSAKRRKTTTAKTSVASPKPPATATPSSAVKSAATPKAPVQAKKPVTAKKPKKGKRRSLKG